MLSRYPLFGAVIAPEITTENQVSPDVAVGNGGRTMTVWVDTGQAGMSPDGYGPGVFARIPAAGGTPAGPQFGVSTTATGAQVSPAVAWAGSGCVVSWTLKAVTALGGSGWIRHFEPPLREATGFVSFYLLTTLIALPGVVPCGYVVRSGLADVSTGTEGTGES